MEKTIKIPKGYEARIEGNEVIFELKESEDEKIRKTLLEYFNERNSYRDEDETFNGIPFPSIIAYLEKQKEQKHLLNFDAISSWLRDHTSRYVNSEYNEFHHCTEYDGTINVERLIADLKVAVDSGAFDVHKQKEQKLAEWSEEDERKYKVILELLNAWANGTIGGYIIPSNADRDINWFKSLPERFNLPPKQEWNKEDELNLYNIIEAIKFSYDVSEGSGGLRLINWLKYRLRYQPHWKPSKEQMEILSRFNDPVLKSLHYDLLKLL